MLKLKKNVVEFLETFVKPEKLDEVKLVLERAIQAELKDGMREFNYVFNKEQSFRPITMAFTLDDFQEELEPYKWYERKLFDGNPKRYWLVERDKWVGDCGEECITASTEDLTTLKENTTHFMYIKNVWS